MGFELEVLIAISCGCSGLLCGWLLREPSQASGHRGSDQAEINRTERDRLEKLADQLKNVTSRVSANVDAHQTKIQEVSDSLSDTDEAGDKVFDAVASLIEANAKMQKQLGDAQNQIRAQAQAIESAEELALTDGLTSLSNRRAFDRHMEQRFAIDDTDVHPTTFMILDVDHFKKFNDVYGHLTGDEVLKHVARILNDELSDIGFVARYGGEEFAVIFDDLAITDVKERADEVRASLGQKDFVVDGQSLRITASAGLAQLQAEDTIPAWIERADSALYTAKDEGRDRAYWMDGDIAFPVKQDEEINSQIAEAENFESERDADSKVATAESEQKSLPELPTLEMLNQNISASYLKLQAERIPFCLLAIQIKTDEIGDDWQQVALASIHASIRGIDAKRIGFDQESTFVVCLPSTDEGVAQERANLVRETIMSRSGNSGTDSAWEVCIAAICASSSETFAEALLRVKQEVHEAMPVEA